MTSFRERLFGRPQPPKADWKAVTGGAWLSSLQSGYTTSLGESPQRKAAACLRAYKVGWFYKGGRKIADSVSALDWSISDGDAESGDAEAELERPDLDIPFGSLGPIDQLQRLLERPNPYQTGRQLLHKTQVRLDFAGTAFWYLEGAGGGLPTGLYGISPARMWPSYDRNGRLIGWVMDKDSPSGGTPFDAREILTFSTGNAESDMDPFGVSVVEAVYAEVPLTDLMARHTGNVLTTGGRLAGMIWPKERSLGEDEFTDAQRAWRNVTSDPDAAKRLLLFPEPMEYASGASTPAEIGIPELAALNRDNILTAFPISPYQLGVPMPGGLNSGETRREDRRDFWEGTIEPRVMLLKETIQTGLVSLYEAAEGRTYDFDLAIPNLDDAATLTAKATAYKDLVGVGLDPKEALTAVGLDHIKWIGLPPLLDPANQAALAQAARDANAQSQDQAPAEPMPQRETAMPMPRQQAKGIKAREDVASKGKGPLAKFLIEQQDRVEAALRAGLPAAKAKRLEAIKSPAWWDIEAENDALRLALNVIYSEAGRLGMQLVADSLNRIVPNKAVSRIVADLAVNAGQRINAINDTTLQALTIELAEGARRGYSINQLIEGVPDEGYRGVKGVTLDNGAPVFGDYRAETIARTETALAYNRASLDGYLEFNVSEVLAYDGDGDPECAERNGQTFTLDEAFAIEDHPNGTLDWAPVLDKSYHAPEPQPVIVNNYIGDAMKASGPAEVHVHVPEVKVPDVVADVNPLIAAIRESGRPTVDLDPIVKGLDTVAKGVDKLLTKDPVINVTPEVKAPDVTVNVESVRVVSMPDRKHVLTRDKQGKPTGSTVTDA